jgi:hypothetical protein
MHKSALPMLHKLKWTEKLPPAAPAPVPVIVAPKPAAAVAAVPAAENENEEPPKKKQKTGQESKEPFKIGFSSTGRFLP